MNGIAWCPYATQHQRRQHIQHATCHHHMHHRWRDRWLVFSARHCRKWLHVYRPKEYSLKSMISNHAWCSNLENKNVDACNKCWWLYESAKPPQPKTTKINGSHYSQSRYSLAPSSGCNFRPTSCVSQEWHHFLLSAEQENGDFWKQRRPAPQERLRLALKTPVLDICTNHEEENGETRKDTTAPLVLPIGSFFLFEQTWPSLWNVGTDSARRKSEFGKTRKNFVMVSGGRTPFLGNQKHLFRIRHILHQRDLGMLLTCRSRLHFFTNFWALKPILIWQKMTKECLLEDRLVKTLSLCYAP